MNAFYEVNNGGYSIRTTKATKMHFNAILVFVLYDWEAFVRPRNMEPP